MPAAANGVAADATSTGDPSRSVAPLELHERSNAMPAGIMYVACPKCGKKALELVSFHCNMVSIECDFCDYSSIPQAEPELESEPKTDSVPE
jgi:hypothetical protein